MNRKYFLFILFITSYLCSLKAATTANDSIAVKNLDELVVTGDRMWISDGIVNIVPSKQEKKLSDSPASLIKAMHLPFVQEKDGVVTSLSGEEVKFFINGEKADEIDIATFWPKHVKLVQYIDNPGDPTYEGAKHVINFSMREYEAGGVTRVRAFQRFPNNGIYTAASY